MHFVEKKATTNFHKNETESKMENPTHCLERQTLCSYENRKSKIKL